MTAAPHSPQGPAAAPPDGPGTAGDPEAAHEAAHEAAAEAAHEAAAEAAAEALAEPVADGVLRAMPEPALLVTATGAICAANAAAAALFGTPVAALRGTWLPAQLIDGPADVRRYLEACARTRAPLPGALQLRAPAGSPPGRLSVTGAVVRPAAAAVPALILLRGRAGVGASSRFALLNRQLDDLTREVQARRAAEAALREANQQLQEQTLEVELANQQLQDQALELEHQMESARALTEELAQANVELAAAVASMEAARRVAEQASQAKTEFLAVMSHELRTPLNAIGGYAELLAFGVRGPLTEAQCADVARIQRSQRHLLRLIDALLNFARLEQGQVTFAARPVPLADVVTAAAPLVEPQRAAKDVALELRLPASAEASPVVLADREYLEQVLLNLLSNAVKFTPAGGRVTVELGDASGGAGVVGLAALRVSDTGIGIPVDQRERIFAPFVQLDQTLTRPHEGVGLGLAISRDLVRGMGGDLTVEGTPGVGSTFLLTLPRA